jgi:putative membrane protein
MTIMDLPAVNGSLNGLSAVFLGFGYFFIKRGNRTAHRNCMIAAFITSTIFLACYLTYHTYLGVVLHRGPTRFLEPAWFRPIYLTILLTHTVLAVVIVPLVFMTLSRGLKQRFDAHKKIARWTWPLWMYVSVTGVLIYFLLYQIFPQRQENTAAPSATTAAISQPAR